MKFRQLYIIWGLLLWVWQGFAQSSGSNKLYIPEMQAVAGSTASIPVHLDNSNEIVAFQFDLEFPGRTSPVLDGKGHLAVELSERMASDVVGTYNRLTSNKYRLLVFSPSNSTIGGIKGKILSFQAKIEDKEDLIGKTIKFEITNVILSKKDAGKVDYTLGKTEVEIVRGNRPDLEVSAVDPVTVTAKPGEAVKVNWMVRNIGNQPTKAGWKESVYLVDGDNKEILLGNLNYGDVLSANGQVSRSAEFRLNEYPGLDGNVRVKVKLTPNVDAGELEADAANNTSLSVKSLNLLKTLTFRVAGNVISETAKSGINCYVYRSGSRSAEESFTIGNSNPSRLVVPEIVLIPEGQSGASFIIKPIDDPKANPDSTAVITIQGGGYGIVEQTIRIEDDEQPFLKLSIADGLVVSEGGKFTLTLEREWDIPWPLTVKLASDHPKRFETFPSEVVIPAGTGTKEVTIKVKDDDLPGLDDEVVFTASAPGHEFDLKSKRFVTIKDNDVPNIALELSTSMVSEANQVVTAILKRSGITDNRVTVNLTDDGDGRINIPVSIVLEPGVAEKQFAITTVDNAMKDGDQVVTINGAIYVSSCNCSTAGSEAGVFTKQITVLDDDDAKVTSTASKMTLLEGDTGKITVAVNEILSAPLTIQLACDNQEIQLPASVTIPAESRSADVEISVPKNDVSEGNRVVTVVVNAGAYGKSTCWLNITDQTLPDAIIASVYCIKEIVADQNAEVSVSVKNVGASPLPSQTKVSLYLSTSKSISNASVFLGSLYTQEELAVNQSVTLTKTFAFPDKTGNYYVVAFVNEEQNIKELSFVNNTAGSEGMTMTPPFTAIVSLDKSVVKTGEGVAITGQLNGIGTAKAPIDIYVINEATGYRQVMRDSTDNSGIFQRNFIPMNGLYGKFIVGACYPNEGLNKELAAFELYGLKKADNIALWCEAFLNEETVGTIKLTNAGNRSLSNIKAEVLSAPEGCDIQFSTVPSIASTGNAEMTYKVKGTVPLESGRDKIKVKLTSAEGASLELNITYYCLHRQATLQVDKRVFKTNVAIGQSVEYPITITNVGVDDAHNISVVLPECDWMSLASAATIPVLKGGESTAVLLRLNPAPDMDANIALKGRFAINCENADGIAIDYNITPVSTTTGTLVIDVCDEFTYNGNGQHVKDANVRITLPNTETVVAEGMTTEDGTFTSELPAGNYTLTVGEKNHSGIKRSIVVYPDTINKEEVYIQFQAIQVTFKLERTEIEDQYEIKTDVKFETNVPMPVVITEMPEYIPLDKLADGESYVFDVKLTNKGLIAANDVLLIFPEITSFNFELLLEDGFQLKAKESVTIPVKVTKNEAMTRAASNSDKICRMENITLYGYECNEQNQIVKVKTGTKIKEVCYTTPNGPGIGGGGGYGSGTASMTPEELYEYTLKRNKILATALAPLYEAGVDLTNALYCNPVINAIRKIYDDPCVQAILEEVSPTPSLSDIPVVGTALAVKDTWDTCSDVGNGEMKKEYQEILCATQGLSNIADMAGDLMIIDGQRRVVTGMIVAAAGAGVAGIGAAPGVTYAGTGLTEVAIGGLLKKAAPAINIGGICLVDLLERIDKRNESMTKGSSVSFVDDFKDKLQIPLNEVNCVTAILWEILGDEEAWSSCTLGDVTDMFSYLANTNGILVKNDELMSVKPGALSYEAYDKFIDRWNNSIKKWNDEPVSSDNIINYDNVRNNIDKCLEYEAQAHALGYNSTEEMLYNIFFDLRKNVEEASNSVCSTVKLQFSQTMTMTREAFRGTLTIFNGHESIPMEDIKLDLVVKNEDGKIATEHEFEITNEKFEGMNGEPDGEWSLEAQKEGSITILFTPSKYAAPDEPVEWSFGGTLSFKDPFHDGEEVTHELFPVTMTVNPSPNLKLDYFIQQDIFGDDPLTEDVVEPVIPSEFSLLINNVGKAEAKNVKMITRQPEIIDNEKGLLVNIAIKSSQLNGGDEIPAMGESVATDFGTIEAGKTAYAQWWLTSSLLGRFKDYEVNVKRISGSDNPAMSLIDTAVIHTLIRGIRVDELATPKVTGFMVNDIPDAEDFPDMMYLTDGTAAPVVKAKDAKLTETDPSKYELVITPSANGWNYISIPDKTGGRLKLISVNEDTNLDTRKVWQTDRTLRDGKDPKYEYRIHAVDYFEGVTTRASSAGSFTLLFEERPDVALAVDSITGLPESDAMATDPIGEVAVKFNKSVGDGGFTTGMIELYYEGKKVETSSLTIVEVDGQTYQLDLSALTKQNGLYTLTILTSLIKDEDGFTGEEDKTVSWTQQAGGKVQLTMKAEPAEAGTVSPTSAEPTYGSEVDLKATASTGYQFKNWTIDDKEVSTDTPYSHLAVSDQTIVANFTPIPYTIEIKYDAAQGSVSFGTGYYEYNSTLDLIATPNDGYRFIGWFKDGILISSDELYVYKVVGNATLEARFEALSTDPDDPDNPDNPGGEDPDNPDNPDGGDPDDPTANENMETLTIQVYPTQVSDYVHVDVLPAKSRLVLFDLAGRQVKQVAPCEGDVDFYMGDQPSGIYLLYILAGEEQKKTVKLIKK
ncbi:InlB B-repeat-containing protein [Parabacteroides johnsonii]|uniref:InlB B-repeat-containing protein n=1 Tax=Parabacteroides johnsonii TaxID=387661 RepID=UPI00242EEAEC|nr:CARDB domain-containing protein [Parabacteroides johnsonii]